MGYSYKIADTIFAIVRGERPLSMLPELGVEIVKEEGKLKLKSNPSELVVKPTASDIARGLITYRLNRDDLMIWAFFVLGASDINFEKVEQHPHGELLINALWDASFEGKIGLEALRIADSLA
jgi:hypothetical protein